MAIPVVCSCGEHFRAPEEDAGQWASCPACGAPASVPTILRTEPVGLESLPSSEDEFLGPAADAPVGPAFVRLRPRQTGDPNRTHGSVWVPLESEIKAPPEEQERKRERKRALRRTIWKLESHWSQCLFYPFRVWQLVVGLGAALGICAAMAMALLLRFSEVTADADALWGPIGGALAALVGAYAVGFLHCVLTSAVAGEYLAVRRPGHDVQLILRSCLTWLLCFLAGPLLYAGVAYWFWFHVGGVELLDHLILIELALVTVDYWLLGVLAAAEKRSLFAGPSSIAALLGRMGYRAVPALLAPAILVVLPCKIALDGLEELHNEPGGGGFLVAGAGVLGMFLATFYLRYLGILAYRSQTV